MKRKTFLFSAVITCLGIGLITWVNNQNQNTISDLAFENVVALSQSEGGTVFEFPCVLEGTQCRFPAIDAAGNKSTMIVLGHKNVTKI